MKKAVIIAAIAVLAAGGFFLLRKNGKAPSYREIQPERASISIAIRETGTVSPRNRLEIKPPIAGRIEDVSVEEGRKVKKGEIIAWLSSSERAALLDAARAKGEAELKKWEDIYRPTPIIAPLGGFIIARSKEPGQTVGTADVILVMADTLIIEADVDETDLRYIRLGQQVALSLDAYPDQSFKGVVEHIAYESRVVNNVTVYTVKIRPHSQPRNFRAGMTATVEVESQKKDDALLLPYDAVTDKDGAKTVLLKTEKGKPRAAQIETGISNGKKVEVLSGIVDSDIILLGGKAPKTEKKDFKTGSFVPGMPIRGARH
ncbi:MAG: efflux RND transporter periplasmic adaptor subunit [Endomicrobiales bacterium]